MKKINLAKKTLSIVLSLVLLMSSMAISGFAADFDDTWTAIETESDLAAIADNMDGKYYLAKDITLTGEWTPIGYVSGNSQNIQFEGEFDGNGHTISGMTINNPTTFNGRAYSYTTCSALFAENNGVIKNLTLEDPTVVGGSQLGGIAAINYGTISLCTVMGGEITGEFIIPNERYGRNMYKWDGYQVGGIAGVNCGTIEKCKNSWTNVGGWFCVGGITGENQGTISQCAAACNVNVPSGYDEYDLDILIKAGVALSSGYHVNGSFLYRAAGIAGFNTETGTIQDAYFCSRDTNSIPHILGYSSVGGICGLNFGDRGAIDNVYAAMFLLSYPPSGGALCPLCESHGVGVASSSLYVHTLVGDLDNAITDSFFPTGMDLPTATAYKTDRGTKCSASEMLDKQTYLDAGWDFDNIWTIDPNTGLPMFGWELGETPETPDCTHPDMTWTDNGNTHTGTCNNPDCDYTEANKPHVDDNGDGICDLCGHGKDLDGDHKCDECQNVLAHECIDENKDHKCDICGAAMGTHEDKDKDHNCDYGCSDKIGEHTDKDGDGLCDYCGKEINHHDGDGDNHCDHCGAFLGTGSGGTGSNSGTHSQEGLDWVYVDNNNHNGVCKTCNKVIIEHEPHEKGEVVSTTVTCGEAGETTYKCVKCGHEFTLTEPATGNHDYTWTDNGNGTHDGECNNCGATVTGEVHEVSEWTEYPATCGKDAYKTGTCDKCGAELTVTETGTATGAHDYTWTDKGNGTHDGACKNCDATVVGEAHEVTEWTEYPATCGKDAYKTGTCDKCGAEVTVTTGTATGDHEYVWTDNGNGTHDGACKNCDATVEGEAHKVTTWTEHAATCDKDAYKTGTCDKCGAEVTVTETGTATGDHKDDNHDHVCDNCGANVGKHEDTNGDGKCDYCGKEISHVDADGDGKCDNCGTELNHVDKDGDGKCDNCGKEIGHVDADGDGKCDYCGKDIESTNPPKPPVKCSCWCHRDGKIYKVMWKIALAFYKLFGTHKHCKCGAVHF